MTTLDVLPAPIRRRIRVVRGHWLWTPATHAAGYGQIMIGGQSWLAHRRVWFLVHGTLPQNVHHVCPYKACVRPDSGHLRPMTTANHARLHGADRTHCDAGHEYTPENTYVRPDGGGRMCRKCTSRRRREGHARNPVAENLARSERRRRQRVAT